jgi:CRISPR-associated protein Cas1
VEIRQNVLYVMTQGAYIRRDHQTIQVEIEGKVRLAVPIHHLLAVSLFGNIMVSPGAMQCCTEAGISLTFHSESGRLLARVDSPVSGNVLLRREQFRKADSDLHVLRFCRSIVAGKLQNTRLSLLRSARDKAVPEDAATLTKTAEEVASLIRKIESTNTSDEVRGLEGAAARAYFGAFHAMIRQDRESFRPKGRTRRPPLDRMNALLSYIYALLLADCVAGLTAAGLDVNVGFLHSDRPGKPSLALDLMEEFRPMLADRLALTLVNRKQLQSDDFEIRDGGAVEIKEKARRVIVTAWQERKQERVVHPLLNQETSVSLLMHIQARILARAIRGEIDLYVPCSLK